MSENEKPIPSSDALERTLGEILAAESILEGRNSRLLQNAVETVVKELSHDPQLHSKLQSETRIGMGHALGKFLAWKVWTEIEKADRRKAAVKSANEPFTLRLPARHLAAVKEGWPAVRAAFTARVGFSLSEPTLEPGEEGWTLELRGGLLGHRVLDDDWFRPLLSFLVAHAAYLLSLNKVKQLIDDVRANSPVLGEELERLRLPVTAVYRVLEGLLAEGVSIQELETILTTLTLAWEQRFDRGELLSLVRRSLSPWLCREAEVAPGLIRCVKIGPNITDILTASRGYTAGEPTFEWEASKRAAVSGVLRDAFARLNGDGKLALVADSRFRTELRSLLVDHVPDLKTLSETEIHRGYRLHVVEVVDLKTVPRTAPTEETVTLF